MIVDQAEEDYGVGNDGCGVDVDLVAALDEGSEVHLKGSSDVIKGDPLMWSQPG